MPNSAEVQVKLVGPSTPPFRDDIVELKTQIIGMQPVPGSYRFSEKSGPQAITVVTDSEAQFNINQGDYETSDPDIKCRCHLIANPWTVQFLNLKDMYSR